MDITKDGQVHLQRELSVRFFQNINLFKLWREGHIEERKSASDAK